MTVLNGFNPSWLGGKVYCSVVLVYDLWLDLDFIHIADLLERRLLAVT